MSATICLIGLDMIGYDIVPDPTLNYIGFSILYTCDCIL